MPFFISSDAKDVSDIMSLTVDIIVDVLPLIKKMFFLTDTYISP